MPSWTEELEQIAGKLIDLHNDCPGRHSHVESCPRCSCLLGLSEVLLTQAKTAEIMEPEADPFLPVPTTEISNVG